MFEEKTGISLYQWDWGPVTECVKMLSDETYRAGKVRRLEELQKQLQAEATVLAEGLERLAKATGAAKEPW
jgi:hypothetical protein